MPSSPYVPDPTGDFGALMPIYADVILSYSSSTGTVNCSDGTGIPVCVMPQMPQTGTCAGNPALGPPDSMYFTIPANGTLELGFLCSVITARASLPPMLVPDFVLYGTLMGGASPAVEVSSDGTNYVSVNPWTEGTFMSQPAAQFQLSAATNIVSARFVRISETSGQGSIFIDSLEAVAGLVQ